MACALADDPITSVGIDTEPLAAAERLQEISNVFATSTELAGFPDEPAARAVRMVEVWTAKEALLKALGEGFSGEEGFGVLSRLESTPLGLADGWGSISVRDARSGAVHSVWRRWLGSHVLALVALEGNQGEPRLMGVSLT